jgi:hypothetical protein
MTTEQLEKANILLREIKECESNIKIAKYTQSEQTSLRDMDLKIFGVAGSIKIPDNLKSTVGKLVLSEYQQKIMALKKELEDI